MDSFRVTLWIGLLATPAFPSDVLVVDILGGSAFTDIGTAIGAAANGDVILVRPGQYDPFPILSGKSVSILAEQPGTVTIGAPSTSPPYTAMLIANLPAGRPITLAGLRFRASIATDLVQGANAAVQLNTCLSPVTFQDCEFVGGRPCLDAWQCVGVTLERSILSAGGGSPTVPTAAANSGRAIRAGGATMLIHECSISGGDGSPLHTAKEALHDVGSLIFVQNGEIRGGDGGAGLAPGGGGCTNGGDGAPGIVVELGAPIHRLGATIAGGDGGAASGAPCSSGSDGPAFQFSPGVEVPHPGVAPSLRLPTWQHEATSGSMQVSGESGVPALLFLGSTPAFVSAPGYSGALRIAVASLITIPLGVIPPAGDFQIPYSLPALPSGIDFASVQLQVATLGATPAIGGARAFYVVDSLIP